MEKSIVFKIGTKIRADEKIVESETYKFSYKCLLLEYNFPPGNRKLDIRTLNSVNVIILDWDQKRL